MGIREPGGGGKDNKIVSGGPEVRMRTLKKKCPEELTHIFNNDKIEEMFSGEYLRRHLLMCPQMSPPMFPSMRPPMCPPMFPAMCPPMCPPTQG